MMLQSLLETALAEGLVGRSRIGPLTTAVKQYARMLGEEAKSLPPDRYHLSKPALFDYIETHAPETLGPRALANLKDNLRWLLDLGVAQKWLIPPVGPVIPWDRQNRRQARPKRPIPADQPKADRRPYCLLLPLKPPDKPYSKARQRYFDGMRVGRSLLPEPVRQEMEAYLSWCARAYAPGRAATIKKRPVTSAKALRTICNIGGYAVHIGGMPLSEVSLVTLTDPTLVEAFVGWWINQRRQRVTVTIVSMLNDLKTLAAHWLKRADHADAIKTIMKSLSKDIPSVWDKDVSLMSLRELERVGLSCYPFSEEHLQSSRYAREVYRHIKDPEYSINPGWHHPHVRAAAMVQMSVIIRLLVRIPMRQRNIREMKLDHNLKRTSDGWEIHFRGPELKVGFRHGQVNEYRQPVPKDIEPRLEEWLTVWRPRQLSRHSSATESDLSLVFVNSDGKPLTGGVLCNQFTRTIYRFTGRYTTPHMVRDAWASEYLDATGDIAGAADKLGDLPATVMENYAHILKRKAQNRTDLWLNNHLA